MGSLEDQVRLAFSIRDDLPDWMYMKAIEVSRVFDEAQEDGRLAETIVSHAIFGQLGLERRIASLESWVLGENNAKTKSTS